MEEKKCSDNAGFLMFSKIFNNKAVKSRDFQVKG